MLWNASDNGEGLRILVRRESKNNSRVYGLCFLLNLFWFSFFFIFLFFFALKYYYKQLEEI